MKTLAVVLSLGLGALSAPAAWASAECKSEVERLESLRMKLGELFVMYRDLGNTQEAKDAILVSADEVLDELASANAAVKKSCVTQ